MKWLGLAWDDARFWMHFALGFLGAWTPPVCLLALTYLFINYELNEDIYLKDKAFIDIQGGVGGVLIAGLIQTALIVWFVTSKLL